MQGLLRRSLEGLAQLTVAMALFLFLPAWTLNYWQAWLFLSVFIGSSALITLYLWRKDPELLERRLKAGPGAEKERAQKIIQSIAAISFCALLVVPALDRHFQWSEVSASIVLAADAVVVVGFSTIFLVFRENSFTASTIEVSADQKVISSGPYAIVRHPMYSGALMMMLATPIALGSWWGAAAFVPLAASIVWRVLNEEKYLSANLPGYSDYRQKVRTRLLPLVW